MMKEGILTRFGSYGFQINNKDEWFNFAKTTNGKFRDIAKRLNRKIVEFEIDDNGAVILLRAKEKQSKSIENYNSNKVKVISSKKFEDWERQMNEFSLKHNVFATQTLIKGDELVGVCYYNEE